MKKIMIAIGILISMAAQAEESPKVALATLKSLLNEKGAPVIAGEEKTGDKVLPVIKFGGEKINNSTKIIDEVVKKHGGTATIFVKKDNEFFRVATNIKNDDGTIAFGTQLARNAAYGNIMRGESYCGIVDILGKGRFDTCYEAIKDGQGQVVGIYYVGYKK